MKYLIMCEGSNEREIINILLENDLLIFTEDDLLGLTPYHARQIASSGQVDVYRIGDAQNETLKIPAEYKNKIHSVQKICTKPELEMLLILAEDMVSDFEKAKPGTKPKTFAKDRIRLGKKKYDNSTQFYRNYFGNNPDLLVHCIREYKRIRKFHKKDEGYLADLLK